MTENKFSPTVGSSTLKSRPKRNENRGRHKMFKKPSTCCYKYENMTAKDVRSRKCPKLWLTVLNRKDYQPDQMQRHWHDQPRREQIKTENVQKTFVYVS